MTVRGFCWWSANWCEVEGTSTHRMMIWLHNRQGGARFGTWVSLVISCWYIVAFIGYFHTTIIVNSGLKGGLMGKNNKRPETLYMLHFSNQKLWSRDEHGLVKEQVFPFKVIIVTWLNLSEIIIIHNVMISIISVMMSKLNEFYNNICTCLTHY